MRTKNTLKTFLYGFLLTSIIAILGLVKTKILLSYLGEEYVGVYQLFYQLFTYLSLVDGGVGASVAFHLYKPIHENNQKEINKIFSGARYYFMIVGFIVIALGIILSLGIMFLIKETTISSIYIRICFILFVVSSSTSYFTTGHALIYESEQKLYKSSNLNHMLSICESVIAIIVSILGGKLLIMITIFLIMSIIKNIILVAQSRKDHQYLKVVKEKDLSFKKEANNLIISKINTLINENVDIIILSKFIGLKTVVIYTAYNQIVTMIKHIIERLNSALLPSVGNLFVSSKDKIKSTFNELNSILFFIGSLIFVPLYYFLSPFIRLWYGNNYIVNNYITMLFVMILYINIIKIPLETYIKASGNFKSVKYSSIYQSVVNITLSLILVKKYGISGVLISTIFAFITGTFFHYPRIIYKNIINDNVFNYYKRAIKYLFGLILNLFVCYFINKSLVNSSIIMWFFNGIVIFILNLFITALYYTLIKENSFFKRFKTLIPHKIKK